jgi:cytidine deaminase
MDQRYKNELIDAAKAGMNNAYTIVNNFRVGAAVLTSHNRIYQGCNTQSVISGLGICAERSAGDHAVVCGEYMFQAIAVTSHLETPIAPCGMCLQYIGEFSQVADHDIEILMVGSTGAVRESSITQMLPVIFGPLDVHLDVSPYRK